MKSGCWNNLSANAQLPELPLRKTKGCACFEQDSSIAVPIEKLYTASLSLPHANHMGLGPKSESCWHKHFCADAKHSTGRSASFRRCASRCWSIIRRWRPPPGRGGKPPHVHASGVVFSAASYMAQDFIGFRDSTKILRETSLVRVRFQCQAAKGGTHIGITGRGIDAQRLIVVHHPMLVSRWQALQRLLIGCQL